MDNDKTMNERLGEFSANLDRAVDNARKQLENAAEVARSEYQAGTAQADADDHAARAASADSALERFWEQTQASFDQARADFNRARAERDRTR